jgi:hypothetical protein
MGIVVPLVTIRYLNVYGVFIFPSEADSILVVDPDAVLAFAISTELFQTIAGRGIEIFHP